MKTVHVVIKGSSALLINRFKEQDEVIEAVKKSTKKDYGTPRAQAEATAYKDEKTGLLWIPSTWISGAIKTVASDYKMPGTRKSVKSVSGGAILPVEEKLYLHKELTLKDLKIDSRGPAMKGVLVIKDLEIDSRPVVIQRARIMRHRARLEEWSVEFHLEIDDEIIPVDNVHQILNDSGKRAGLGDFRPSKGGPFGRFIVTSWKVLKDK